MSIDLRDIHARASKLISDFTAHQPKDQRGIDQLATEVAAFQTKQNLSSEQQQLLKVVFGQLAAARQWCQAKGIPDTSLADKAKVLASDSRINEVIALFEKSLEMFEKNILFDPKEDRIQEYEIQFNTRIGEIFLLVSAQYQNFLQGEGIDAEISNYEEIVTRLMKIVQEIRTRAAPEFTRKLTKERLIKSDTRQQFWQTKEERLSQLVLTLTNRIVSLSAATEVSTNNKLEGSWQVWSDAIHMQMGFLSQLQLAIEPLGGSKEELVSKIVREKERLILMISTLRGAKNFDKKISKFILFIHFYCKPKHPRNFSLQKDYLKFLEVCTAFEWKVVSVESFRIPMMAHFEERINELRKIETRYNTPAKLKQLREGQRGPSEVKQDYKEMSILVFYIRQMMDVRFDEHTSQGVWEAMEKLFGDAVTLCDSLIAAAKEMKSVVKHEMGDEEIKFRQKLLANDLSEVRKNFYEKCKKIVLLFNFFG